MDKTEINFYKCIQDSQEFGSDNEHMISRVFFKINGEDYQANVRQPYGENFSFEENPIEVDMPENLKNKLNYGEFRDEVEKYFRMFVGSGGRGINIGGNSTGIRMMNNIFMGDYTTFISKAGFDSGW